MIRVLSPPVFEGDEEGTRTAAILNTLLWNLIALVVIVGLLGVPFFFAARVGSAISAGLALVALLGVRWLMLRRSLKAASIMLVTVPWVLASVLCVLTGGIYSVNLVLLLSLSVVAGLLLGTRWALGVAGASSLVALTLAILEMTGNPPPKPFPAPPMSRWVEFSVGMALALIPLNMSLQRLAKALSMAKQELRVRLQAEAALRQSEERFRTIYDSVNEAVFLHEAPSGRILDVNCKMTEMFGWSRAEARGLKVGQFSSGEPGFCQQDADDWIARAAVGETQSFEWHARRRDGSLFWGEVSMRPAEIGGQSVVLVTFRDIDERKRAKQERDRLEEQLRQAQKLESIGRLAGGIAHDFNNLLTAILGNLELATFDVPPNHPVLNHVHQASQAGRRAAELTSQLLAFSRKQMIEPRIIHLDEVVSSLQSMLTRLLGETVVLQTSCPTRLGAILADRPQIESVIVNLAVNARDAMPRGGLLTLALHDVDISPGDHPDATPGSYVRLTVTDTGQGMTPEVQANIFEPFFTTKGRGKGTGLGLAMVFGAVTQNGGFIRVQSAPGEGSTFELYWPRVAHEPAEVAVEQSRVSAPQGQKTILLVEDEPTVREVARLSLEMEGHKVCDFGTAELALDALASLGPIQLLITDVVLPGMNGRELADRCRQSLPNLRVLFTSGYTEDAIASHGVVQEGLQFLPKPFRPQDLLEKVDAILAER